MDLGQNFVCDRSSRVLGPVVFCLVTCWISGFLFAGIGRAISRLFVWWCLVCLVILGQVVKSVKWLWVKRLWVLWLSVCLCSFKRLSVWNVGLSDW